MSFPASLESLIIQFNRSWRGADPTRTKSASEVYAKELARAIRNIARVTEKIRTPTKDKELKEQDLF